jgi:4-alpha-glucanotransferase
MLNRRGGGILLHITSLPSAYGIGDLGPWAYRFVDFLADSRLSYWQILPINPIDPELGSPYNSSSTFAGNTLFISPELLCRDGFLSEKDLPKPNFLQRRVEYKRVGSYKEELFHKAYEHFKENKNPPEYEIFCKENYDWVEDFALYEALKEYFEEKDWSKWSPDIRDRDPRVLQSLKKKLREKIEMGKFLQYIFFKQWRELKGYCNERGVETIGDVPIYVDYKSVDVWTNPEIFKLDRNKQPMAVSGVPPDYFSATGQRWGNPVYRWDVLKRNGYKWWMKRMGHNFKLFDFVRIDHFRGLVAYWEIPANEKTAVKGKWVTIDSINFFDTLLKHFPFLPVIAEDLGVITPDVREIVARYDFPGMKLLIFAFGEDLPTNPYAPHNHIKNCIVYTGTHDNNTIRGWFKDEATAHEKARLFQYLGRKMNEKEVHWEFIRLAMMSVANTVILPMQDVLGLGKEARMNRPATSKGNWTWRLKENELTHELSQKLLKISKTYGRT